MTNGYKLQNMKVLYTHSRAHTHTHINISPIVVVFVATFQTEEVGRNERFTDSTGCALGVQTRTHNELTSGEQTRIRSFGNSTPKTSACG